MEQQKTWYEDDDLWQTMLPLLFVEQRWTSAVTEAEDIISLLKISPGARVLDLCCGPGRHSIELARRGFHVTGVDRTRVYLDEAGRRAKVEGLDIEFVEEDMREFSRAEAFDAAMNMFTSFGYFENPEDDRRALTNIYSSLRRGGSLLMDMMGKEIAARTFQERDWQDRSGTLFLEERKVCQNWSWMENHWILIKDGVKKEFRYALRIYSAAELTALLSSCGFSGVEIYGDLKGALYDQSAKRLVAVARKV